MSILPWPNGGKRPNPAKTRKMIVDPLPQSVLRSMVSDIPGPKGETEAARVVRYELQMAEVLSFRPRNAAEVMMAVQCVVMRIMHEDSLRDAARTDLDPRLVKESARHARDFASLAKEMAETLAEFQSDPLGEPDPATFVALGLEHMLIPDPDDPDFAEEPVSATIVPLHPAPKMLQ